MAARQIEKFVVAVAALHSLALGFAMIVRPEWTLRTFGWDYPGPLFFPVQSGVFLLILGTAYAVGVWHRPFAWLLVATKAAAVVFLAVEYAVGDAPAQLVLPALAVDAMLGVAVTAAIVCAMRSQPVLATSGTQD